MTDTASVTCQKISEALESGCLGFQITEGSSEFNQWVFEQVKRQIDDPSAKTHFDIEVTVRLSDVFLTRVDQDDVSVAKIKVCRSKISNENMTLRVVK